MSGQFESYDRGPIPFPVSTAVSGGMVVVPDGTTGMVKPAAGGETNTVGYATTDALPTATNQNPTTPGALVTVNLAPLPSTTSVAVEGTFPCTFLAAVPFGGQVKTAANGQVTLWIVATDAPALIIGRCMSAAGVAAGAVGDVKLGL